MKNRWVKRIATAVTALALAASVFTGLGNSAKAGATVPRVHVESASGDADIDGNGSITVDGFDIEQGDIHIVEREAYPSVIPEGHFGLEVAFTRMGTDFPVNTDLDVEYAFTYNNHRYSGNETCHVDVATRTIFFEDFVEVVASADTDDNTDTGAPSTHKHHTHNWEWTALVNATENQDGTYAMKCTRCNKVDESTITVIAKESVTSDKNLQILGSVKPGETIKLDTKGTAAFNQYFIAELMKHSDSPLEVDFEYKNEKWTLTAPAGFNWPATLDDKGWAGFLRVAGENEEVTAVKR